MKAETVFNVALNLSDDELKKLYTLIAGKLNVKTIIKKRPLKKPLISEDEAIEYLLKTVFKVKCQQSINNYLSRK